MKRFRAPKWPRLENALSLWVNNALNAQQDITGNILKEKAIYFANQFSINDFHSSERLVLFPKRQLLNTTIQFS